ncbi:ATPase domain-containing protein [Hymenobacter nivis]|uniref:ATPase domain-containing protein n=1 Tax=Hymenobacter nivis TaxID=1850093 RepID=UPI0013A536B9|nr:ATPase domain-containing protein [Hymenobacter nivis]
MRGITALFTALVSGRDGRLDMTGEGVSSLVDTWISVRDLEGIGERNRGLSILKARGLAHSNQVREFVVTPQGVELLDVVVGPTGIITGAGRLAQRAQALAAAAAEQHALNRSGRELERKRRVLEATIGTCAPSSNRGRKRCARRGPLRKGPRPRAMMQPVMKQPRGPNVRLSIPV